MRKNLSQLKRQRQDEKRRLRNRGLRSEMRTTLKKAREAVTSQPVTDQTKALVTKASRAVDIMVTKGVLHKNTASRYKSRLIRSYHRKQPSTEKQAQAAGGPAEAPGTGKANL